MPTIPYKLANGTRIRGSTTITGNNLGWNKEPLMHWANQCGLDGHYHRDIAGAAADAGTIGHYLVDCNIKSVIPNIAKFDAAEDLIDKANNCLSNFKNWRKVVNLKVYKTEISMVSERYRYGLTPDCVGWIAGKFSLLDWKTGNGIYPDHLIQLASYKHGWDENYPDMPIEGGYHLIRIDKETADFHHAHYGELEDAWEVFKLLLQLDKYRKILERRT
jgi:hypothetical protein